MRRSRRRAGTSPLHRWHCSHVDLAAIRGDDDAARASKAVDPAQPLLLCLDEREGAGGTVAGETATAPSRIAAT